ncbi:zinc finger protein 507-like [Megalops cyprinoides]|uniref:zinc finger protein 507-like n=1 Tax=Megalops cyprinoides TaxID=118141 RepID=UPI001865481D|nr:zinc finger protein 507-like [Megalops cyprinoides]
MEETSSVAVLVPHTQEQQDTVYIPEQEVTVGMRLHDENGKQKQATDSLIQVIEKLSKIVEKRPRRCSLSGKKRSHLTCTSMALQESRDDIRETPCKKKKDSVAGAHQDEAQVEYYLVEGSQENRSHRPVTCYQCSLCRFMSPTLFQLKEHLQQHDAQQNDFILVCSECCFTSRQQEELEAHVRVHLNGGAGAKDSLLEFGSSMGKELEYSGEEVGGLQGTVEEEEAKASLDGTEGEPVRKKWYSYEQYGVYRCLICSYVCGQQRMLKTHAWKHAGLVDCSYPIFEDELEKPSAPDPRPVSSPAEEAIVVLTSVSSQPETLHSSPSFEIKLCSTASQCEGKLAEELVVEESSEEVDAPKVPVAEDPVVEVQVTTEREQDPPGPDSLLSSAQKIISCSPNSAGHVNVIVERLPGAEESVASKPFLMNTDTEGNKRLLEQASHPVYYEEEEVVIGWCNSEQQQGGNEAPEDPPTDENVPPARRRTHSESLRLHSLAAEALVAMPMRTPELMKASIKSIVELSTQSPDVGQRLIEIAATPHRVPSTHEELASIEEAGATLVGLELQTPTREGSAEGPAKMGISMSLLTVIEKLRERTDQNASDEDILKELQDNAQSQPGGESSSPDSNLVEFIPNSERPFRCRLCRYTSGNKGYMKQHLRVHRQRQPYQCPICEHIAQDSKDLETHMINHCKTRMYHCKQCSETFYYKSQLRNHERDQHGLGDSTTTLIPLTETTAATEETEEKTPEEDISSIQKIYKCDVCDYTSSTYVGVRNHRRIHNSDKPYRCCSCDFATTNMNSLKSHMRRHPQEHQAVQLLEQYRCSMCGYVCSHPPSLKSHMWKHAGDQNYNYEQVNKAINEAISQSSRSPSIPQKTTAVMEQACVVSSGTEKVTPRSDPSAGISVDLARAGVPGTSTEAPQVSSLASGAPSPPEKVGSHSRAGMEYCVLLFCCCICGFESPSKERLMEHMKEHEGEIISIILNKEQQGAQASVPNESH